MQYPMMVDLIASSLLFVWKSKINMLTMHELR